MDEKKTESKKADNKKDVGFFVKAQNAIVEFFVGLKGEASKVVWPSPQELRKSTVTVVITGVLFGGIIFVMDWVFGNAHNLLARLLS